MYPLGCSLCRKLKHVEENKEAKQAIMQVDIDDDDYYKQIMDNRDFKYFNPLTDTFNAH